MDEALHVIVEMTESIWQGFRKDLEGVTPEEAVWRPLPQANSIALIVRHLSIEAQWHRASLERGEPMPSEATETLQRQIDSVPQDLERNLRALEAYCSRPGRRRRSAVPYAPRRKAAIRGRVG